MPPKVSVGMPVYNGQEYVQDAIKAILSQTFNDLELIISDNCSTDRTADICRSAAAADPRVRYVCQQENIGAIGNFNALIELADGEYFKWAAYDDLMEPTFIEKCVDALDQHESIVWCHSKSDMIDADGNSLLELLPVSDEEIAVGSQGQKKWKGHPRENFDSPDPIKRFKGVILGTNWCVDSYGLFRLSALKKTRRLLYFYGAEKVLLGEISLLGGYCEVPELLFYQRVHNKASSNLETAKSQAEFAESRHRSNPFVSARLPILNAHLGAVLRRPLTLSQKFRGICVVFCYLVQFRKWQSVLSKMIRGRGLGGGGRRILERVEHH